MPVRPDQQLLSDRDSLGVAGLAHVRRADLGLTSRDRPDDPRVPTARGEHGVDRRLLALAHPAGRPLQRRQPCLDLKPQTRPILRDEASLCPHVATDVVGVELDRSGVHRMGEIDDVPK